MKISQLISQLEKLKEQLGDLEVYVPGPEMETLEVGGVSICQDEKEVITGIMICDCDSYDAVL